jgi:type I restriction enzyme S subunit
MRKFVEYEHGVIPDSWNVVKLGGALNGYDVLLDIRNGYTGQQSKPKATFKVSRIETIGGGFIDEDRVQYIDNVPPAILDKYLLKKGDILFSHINSDIHLGKTGIALKDYDDLLHGMNLLLFRANEEVIESDFLNYIFNFFRQKGIFISICSRAVNQSSINQAKLKSLDIPLPPKIERRNISHILSTFKCAIEKQQQIIDISRALKKSLLHQLFTQGTKGEKLKETELGVIPESWKMIKIIELGEIVTGTTPRTSVPEYYIPAEFDFIAPADLGKSCKVYKAQKKISKKGLSVSRELTKNTVLCVCIGSTIGKVGLTTKEKSATNQQINSIICDETKTHPLFVYYLLHFYNKLWAEAATPSPVPILSKGSFSKLEIPFTDDLKEQIEIAKTLYFLESKVELLEKKKRVYESLFKTLLNELMTGQLPVHSIDFSSKYNN